MTASGCLISVMSSDLMRRQCRARWPQQSIITNIKYSSTIKTLVDWRAVSMTAQQYENDIIDTDHDCVEQAKELAAVVLVVLTTMDVA